MDASDVELRAREGLKACEHEGAKICFFRGDVVVVDNEEFGGSCVSGCCMQWSKVAREFHVTLLRQA